MMEVDVRGVNYHTPCFLSPSYSILQYYIHSFSKDLHDTEKSVLKETSTKYAFKVILCPFHEIIYELRFCEGFLCLYGSFVTYTTHHDLHQPVK